jgi:enamine deaminase RidA (YjgF/YER057c/UK114 family)
MDRQFINSGSSFESTVGYSRAVIQGNWIFMSGTTGFNYKDMSIADDLVTQTEQCFQNIITALEEAGASLKDIIKVTYIIPDASEFELCWPVMRKYLGDVKPVATMISAGLADPRMKIEIEVTAVKA